MTKDLIDYLQKTGQVKQILTDLLTDDICEILSKHHAVWNPNSENQSDILHDLRLVLCKIRQNLDDCIYLLHIPQDCDND